MNTLRRILDSIFGERTPEGVDEQYWKGRHDRLHHMPFDKVTSLPLWRGCRKPPHGWYCSRVQGHEGPCAARAVPKSICTCDICEHARLQERRANAI